VFVRHETLRQGVIAGIIGAASVAIWFFAVDVAFGRPFHTPDALGRALFRIFGAEGGPSLPYVLGYTIFHCLAFAAAGLALSAIINLAEDEPTVLAGGLIMFVMFEVGFHGVLSMFPSFPVLGVAAWYNVAIGNLIAAVCMGSYMWRTHPALKDEFRYALESRE
jgi:hypothetical protein